VTTPNSTQIQRPQPSPQAAPASAPALKQLQVLVPHPGLQPGQQLAFTAPGSNNQPPRPMTVTVQEAVAPGSVVTVQYPELESRPATAPPPSAQGPSIPLPTLDSNFAEDRNAMVTSWWLYAAGWLCACCCPPCCFLPWGISAAMYFCKQRPERARNPQQRTPACFSVWTMCGLMAFGMLGFIVAVACSNDPMMAEAHHGHHHGHKEPPSMLRGTNMWHAWGPHHHNHHDHHDHHDHHHHHENSPELSWEHGPEPKFFPETKGVAPFEEQKHDAPKDGAKPIPDSWKARAWKAAQVAKKSGNSAPSSEDSVFVA